MIPSSPGEESSTADAGGASTGSRASTRAETASEAPHKDAQAPATRTRTSSAYLAVGVSLVILVVVLDFIIQNLHAASIDFFTLNFRLPVGILVLGGAVAGGCIVLLFSLLRVVQLRRSSRRQR